MKSLCMTNTANKQIKSFVYLPYGQKFALKETLS